MIERVAVLHADGRSRCPWPGTDSVYVAYHDEEWGVPEFDDRALFEKLILDGFQAGLSWITILRKRDAFRRAFEGFAPEAVAGYGPDRVEALMEDAGIVRNRAKIVSAVASARAWQEIQAREGFSQVLWKHLDGRPRQNAFRHSGEVPTSEETAARMSKALRQAGFNFVGPTIVYAFMQAVGMVNDHLVGCFRHDEVRAIGERL